MKKFIIVLVLILSTFLSNIFAQKYEVHNNKIVLVKSTKTVKKDSVYKVIDNITFYKGSKSGIYYYKISKKTNKQYKVYLKQDKNNLKK